MLAKDIGCTYSGSPLASRAACPWYVDQRSEVMTVRAGPCRLFAAFVMAVTHHVFFTRVASRLQHQRECTEALASMNSLSAVSRVSSAAVGSSLIHAITLSVCLSD